MSNEKKKYFNARHAKPTKMIIEYIKNKKYANIWERERKNFIFPIFETHRQGKEEKFVYFFYILFVVLIIITRINNNNNNKRDTIS